MSAPDIPSFTRLLRQVQAFPFDELERQYAWGYRWLHSSASGGLGGGATPAYQSDPTQDAVFDKAERRDLLRKATGNVKAALESLDRARANLDWAVGAEVRLKDSRGRPVSQAEGVAVDAEIVVADFIGAREAKRRREARGEGFGEG